MAGGEVMCWCGGCADSYGRNEGGDKLDERTGSDWYRDDSQMSRLTAPWGWSKRYRKQRGKEKKNGANENNRGGHQ